MIVFFWRGVRLSLSLGVALGALALVAGAACGGEDGRDSGKVRVVTTLPLFADFVREVGGDRVEVISLVPSGADPHTWEPSPSDVKKVAEADIAFANGLDLEPAGEKLIEANLKDGAPFVLLAEGAPPDWDPHLWMDTSGAKKYASVIFKELVRLDPGSQDIYWTNYQRYAASLDELRDYMLTTTDGIREEEPKLVTTHQAFAMFASSLYLRTPAVVAESPGQEPSPQALAELRELIERENVRAVFREPQIDAEGRVLEQAADDAGVRVCTLYSDSLDDTVTSYIEMMRFNAEEIARCLGGENGG